MYIKMYAQTPDPPLAKRGIRAAHLPPPQATPHPSFFRLPRTPILAYLRPVFTCKHPPWHFRTSGDRRCADMLWKGTRTQPKKNKTKKEPVALRRCH